MCVVLLILVCFIATMVLLLRPRNPDARFLPHNHAHNTGAHAHGSRPVKTRRDKHVAFALDVPEDPDAHALWLVSQVAHRRNDVVVLLHGGGNNRLYGFWYLIDTLIAHGYDVVTFDLPGHGNGGRDLVGTEPSRRRVQAILTSLRNCGPQHNFAPHHNSAPAHSNHTQLTHPTACQPRRIFVLGQSMGGALALDVLTYGGHTDSIPSYVGIDGVVAVSAPISLPFDGGFLRELGNVFTPGLYRALLYGSVPEIIPAFGGFGRDRMPLRVPAGKSYVDSFRELLADLDLPTRLRAARMPASPQPPALIVHGSRDGIVDVSQARVLAESSGATLAVRTGLHHIDILLDRATVRLIIHWLDEPRT